MPAPESTPSRTPAQYAELVRHALRVARTDGRLQGRPQLPKPQSPGEYHVLLDFAHQELDRLTELMRQAFPSEEPAPDLSYLSFEEKMALGEAQSAKLAALAYKISPLTVLDRLDEQLGTDEASRQPTQDALNRMRG